MHEFALTDIACSIDLARLAKRVHVDLNTPDGEVLSRMVADAEKVARPKAYYRLAYIEDRGEDWITVEGTRFSSRVLAVNVASAHRLFLFAATCGVELDELFRDVRDILESYWADMIKESVLRVGFDAMNRHIEETWKPGKTSMMSPGSLEDWPITEQTALFALLGDTESRIGLQLMESLLMNPTKSLSGIRFPMEKGFESCQLCPREVCEGRRAPYQPELMEERYQAQ